MARLLTPVALVPVAFGALANIGVRAGLYGPDVRMLLIIVFSAVALLFLAFWAAKTLGRERSRRDSLTNALERSTVMIVDGHGTLQHWPPACEALYGWTAAEVLGRRPGEFLNVEGASVREATRAAIRDHGEWRGEIQHWTKSGELMMMVILGGAGTLTGPLLGAAAMVCLETFLAAQTENWQLYLGFILLAMGFKTQL